MLKIRYWSQAKKFARRLPYKQQRQIGAKIMALGRAPKPPDSIKLKGKMKHFFRVDVGEYRIIYRIEGDTLYISAVGKRNDDEVYRDAKRRL